MNLFLKIFNSRLNPFGNYDDPIPPVWVFEKYKSKFRAYCYWYFVRNPLHNFTHYWIGTKLFPSVWKVWHPTRCFNLILPFFSIRFKAKNYVIEFYLGWRPKEDGSQVFGGALRISKIKNV